MRKRFVGPAALALSVAIAVLGPLASVSAIALGAEPTTFSVNPRGTYLRTNSDVSLDPLKIDLMALAIGPGDLVRLERLGAWDCGGPCTDTVTAMSAVFSAGNALLSTTQPHRVPGAIEAGANIATGPTFNGSLPNDIPEDFPVADTAIQVPAGATHLFVAAPDSLYSDNSDPNGDFKIRISEIDATPPAIVASITGTLVAGDWYVSDVTLSWSVTDPESAVSSTSGCDTTTLTDDTTGTSLICTATSAGGTDSESVVIMIDRTAPTISASRSPLANEHGWNNTDVTVAFVCSDALSGTASCTSPVVFTAEGVGLAATGTVTDLAGNEASATIDGIDIDKTAPTVVYTGNSLTYTVNEQIAIACTASDDLSGVDSDTCADVSGPASAFPLGANTFSATALDLAGNQASGSTTFIVLVTETSLCNLVQELSDHDGIANSLCAKLEAAEASDARGNFHASDGQLRAFVNELEAQSGEAFTAEEAELLIALAGAL
jgi:hypothetical protein